MKILIAAVSSAATPDGVSRHAANLAACLLLQPEIERVDLVTGSWQRNFMESLIASSDDRLHIHLAKTPAYSPARNLWYLYSLPLLARRLTSELVHLTYPVPVRSSRFFCPVVLTLHDLYPYDAPRNFGYPRVLLNRLILHQCLRVASRVACVSESTLSRLTEHRPTLSAKATCICNCIPPLSVPRPAPEPIASIEQLSFLLAVAQHRSNKNLSCTVFVFKRLLAERPLLHLVIVGNHGPETDALKTWVARQGLRDRVLLLSGIAEPQLHWCYRHCLLLLATSTTEGFGLAVAEAMLIGCPVVCSDIPAFRELGEGYCHLMPLTQEALADGVRSALDQPRPEAVALPHLSPSVIAAQYLRLYRSLVRRSRPVVSSLKLNDLKSGSI